MAFPGNLDVGQHALRPLAQMAQRGGQGFAPSWQGENKVWVQSLRGAERPFKGAARSARCRP